MKKIIRLGQDKKKASMPSGLTCVVSHCVNNDGSGGCTVNHLEISYAYGSADPPSEGAKPICYSFVAEKEK